ncbi:Major facilitator superfamily domain, general substrate transporter [Niveomyces insectorum RCEF 264]|uniref:Major facilitator superfamily domain, general substrate transporter n=1 Tax=Niveomyces insectorum RCEF 264 TaxID=1081102 RepID=A0A167T961_9HYPO|nr:Major facilitator superfamily domain, general substrate transporter [Niveomyces insectorum RCEF 264]
MDAKEPTDTVEMTDVLDKTGDGPDSEYERMALEFLLKDEEWHAYKTKRLLWKIDLRLLPWLVLMYTTNFLDRTALAQARLGTLEKDLNLGGVEYNTITSILFIGYIVFQLPSNLLLTKVRPSLYLCLVMAIWGMISACQAATRSYPSELVCRLFLGAAEAPFFSGAIFLMSSWYRTFELTHRIAILFAGVALANMFGGLIGAGVLSNLNGAHGIAGWRWLFIIEGCATTGIALIAVFFMPDYPNTTRWLSKEEQAYAEWRLARDLVGERDDRNAVTPMQALTMAFTDYRTYLFMLMHHANLLAQSFQYFFPTIVASLGYNNTITLLLTVPVWFATLLAALAVSYNSSRTQERCFHMVACMSVAAVGNIVVITTNGTGPRMFAMYLMPMGVLASFQISLAWITSSFPRPLSKRAVVVAATGMFGNLSSIYGSYMYPATDGPKYVPAGIGLACVCMFCAGMALVNRYVLGYENKRLARGEVSKSTAGLPEGFQFIR